MGTELAEAKSTDLTNKEETSKFVTMRLDGQLFGLPVEAVQDVLRPQAITKVPLSHNTIAGLINLRGRIVTVIDMRTKMGFSKASDVIKHMKIVVEHDDDLYSLIVDSVGEVMDLPVSRFEPTPPHLSQSWQSVSSGVYRLKEEIMIVFDISTLFEGGGG